LPSTSGRSNASPSARRTKRASPPVGAG
jgi:hypothetical protein